MKRPIFFKIFGTHVLITALVTFLIVLLSFRAIRSHYLDTLTNDLRNLATALSLEVTPTLDEAGPGDLDAVVKDLGFRTQTRVTVIDPEGIVLADSERDPRSMENHRTRPEIIRALRGEVGRSVRYSTTVKEEMLYVAIPLKKNGTTSGVLRVSLFLRNINKLLASLRRTILYIALIVLAISLVSAGLFSRNLSKPIRELGVAARKIASGDFSVRVFLKNRDELRWLADSFNHMAARIQNLFAELSQQKDRLHGIISSMQSGLIVLDEKRKIVMGNQSFASMVGTDSIEGRFYWEVMREPRFGELMKQAEGETGSLVEEITIGPKVFLCSIAHLESREGMVVVFHDVTKIKNLDMLKRDFVVNVSHELRTPLTAIKGFAETMEEEYEGSGRYLDIIRRHTDRLINVVDDLLSLSELEERGGQLEIEKVDPRELVGNVLKMFEQRLREKKLDLRIEYGDDLPCIMADPYRLEQMLINLIDNAIKYTEEGAVRVSARRKDNALMIEIEDTGTGIPEEHLERLFERFYVVDKSRSRKLGGTGLGLAIVKHIVLLHNGKIDVDSSPGVGSKFTIVLPVIVT